MADGYSRNLAEYYANCINKMKFPYKTVAMQESLQSLLWYAIDAAENPAFNQGR